YVKLRHAIWETKEKEWIAPPDGKVFKIEDRNDRVMAYRYVSKICANLVGNRLEKMVMDIENSLKVKPFKSKTPIMMTSDQIIKLQERGHIIGSHT
ncbi:hypothetical protein C6A37_12380, partial [Desulfobacteraceae bacterium SEEP-SAG9]